MSEPPPPLQLSGHLIMLPGIMAMILQLLALANSAGQVVLEKEEGTLARDWSQGVPPQLSLLMQLLVQLLVVLAQVQIFRV